MDDRKTESVYEEQLPWISESPRDGGILELIVARPVVDARIVQEIAELRLEEGLVGDNWLARGSRHTADGRADPDMQVALMNRRVIQIIVGDQLYVDLDLSYENIPTSTLLTIGTAVLEITPRMHTGCGKFSLRFGPAAIRLVNSREGRQRRLRGAYARVVQAGVIRVGDATLVSRP